MPEDSHHLADSKSEVEACLTKIVLIHEQFFWGVKDFWCAFWKELSLYYDILERGGIMPRGLKRSDVVLLDGARFCLVAPRLHEHSD